MTSPSIYYVSPAGRATPRLHQAALIALWERLARVSLRDPLRLSDRRGR